MESINPMLSIGHLCNGFLPLHARQAAFNSPKGREALLGSLSVDGEPVL